MEIDLHQILIDLGFEVQDNVGIDEESHYTKDNILIINGMCKDGEYWIEDKSGKLIETEQDIKALLISDTKLKAVEIYNLHCDLFSDDMCHLFEAQIKQHALISCNLIINMLFQHHEIDFWKQVKEEIEKL